MLKPSADNDQNAEGRPVARHASPDPAPSNPDPSRDPWKSQAIFADVRQTVKEMFAEATGSHDWEHTQRVGLLCQRIGPAEGADMEVLLVAALLHDIGRGYQDATNGKVCHARKGAELAQPIVAALPFSTRRKQNIIHCIRSHRFRGTHAPATLEAKILFDADKLDAIGAVGVARAYLFAGEVGARLHNPDLDLENTTSYSRDDTGYREYQFKLIRIKDRIMTATGRQLARERHEFMVAFFNRFLEEYEGKR